MGNKMKSFIIFMTCTAFSNCISHTIKRPPSNIVSHNFHRRPSIPKFPDYHTSDAVTQLFLQSPPLSMSPSSSNHHFQWWDTGSPEVVQSGWYGFNRYSPRSGRSMRGESKSRTAYLLGESSQMYPNINKQFSENQAIFELLRELQRNIHPMPQRQTYMAPRIIMIDDAVGLPPGILVPVRHPLYQPHFTSYQSPRKDMRSASARYQQRQMPSTPMPVTIKVVPLKISSADIANALKSMSFLPFPLDIIQNGKGDDGSEIMTYSDKRPSSEEDSGLPPPSSHVAMPIDKPLGITYADSQRSELSLSKYQP